MSDKEHDIQADETADVEATETETVEGDPPSTDTESEQTVDDNEVTEDVEVEEEFEPFRHTVKYKADGKEDEFHFEYDQDGNFTPETEEKVQSVLAHQGLQRVVSDKDTNIRKLQQESTKRQQRIEFLERQLEEQRSVYHQPIEQIRQHPQFVQALDKQGIKLPDTKEIEIKQREAQIIAKERRMQEDQLMATVTTNFRNKYPDFTPEQNQLVGEALTQDPVMTQMASNPNVDFNSLADVAARQIDFIVADLRLKNELPNHELEKARLETEQKAQEIKKVKKRAEQRAAVKNPLAGGRPKSQKGKKDEVVDMKGWDIKDTIYFHRTGKVPPHLQK